jgi:hypothetical protein
MMHRGAGREHGWLWKLGRDLLVMAVFAGLFSVVFILGDLLFYGTVNW